MRGFVYGTIGVIMFAAIWFPQTTGHAGHKIFNELKIGWNSIP